MAPEARVYSEARQLAPFNVLESFQPIRIGFTRKWRILALFQFGLGAGVVALIQL
jgi:hypothetical protein